ncbi:DNA adenine methylase [bacterium]|nr:DNA adenine methylase [bacterium]
MSDISAVETVEHQSAIPRPQPSLARPFLKWAGGKSQILPDILSRIPKNFKSYYEPFLGGGAVFFALQPRGASLSDINPELINVYQVIRDQLPQLIQELSKFKYSEREYYRVRNLDRDPGFWTWSSAERAARIIYLNKTCFNGLFRVNQRGQFNVPFGAYQNPKILDAENLTACSQALQGVDLAVRPYSKILEVIEPGDFIYADPPYVPISKTASFTSFAKTGFTLEDQAALRDFALAVDRKGAYIMLSNADTPLTRELYQSLNVVQISAPRMISARGQSRTKVFEVIATNY